MTVQTVGVPVEANGAYPKNGAERYISADLAVRKAKNYLTKHVSLHFRAEDPVLINTANPVWQLLLSFKTYGMDPYRVGFLEVDAFTGDPIPLQDEYKQLILDLANAHFARSTPQTTTSE